MKKLLTLSLFGLALTMNGCKESGCTDTFADNYVATAELEDGSCYYGIDLVFYFNEARADYYYDNDAYSPMHVVINDTDVGAVNWYFPYEDAPTCNETVGTVNHKIELSSKIENIKVEIVDQLGNSFGSEIITLALSDGDCQAILF
ncbi:hypothetical protein OAV92_00070 [Crocinitomicaceae bacterium]|jgi:hypothetical protein|nr:hypothetical protein [Crocinitomicaceae bacterium]